MVFNSITFLLFFLAVYGLYWVIHGWTARRWLLLAASYVFYAAWSPPYVLLLLFSTGLDWWLARLMGRSESPRKRRILLWISLAGNLCLLGYFKYGTFLLDNTTLLLSAFGIAYEPPQAGILLPIGISFYTFASLSYTIDVYRGEVRSDWSFSEYALFVSFFPHLVAGPILRARNLLPQIASPRQPKPGEIGWGLLLFCFGLFCKVVMADSIFAPVVDEFYASPQKFGAADAWFAVFAFSGQIYYDFNGYSLCAIGLALCFGYIFPENFHHPYAARGFSDFWRRWHISLSSWLRDYVYVPLGGNRLGEFRRFRNMVATMLLGGLWHGASWMFVLWGGLHGCFLVAERVMARRFSAAVTMTRGKERALQIMVFVLVSLTWIPFRAPDQDAALAVVSTLLKSDMVAPMSDVSGLLAMLAMTATVAWHMFLRERRLDQVLAEWGMVWQTVVATGCLLSLFLFSGGDQRAFIYFQF
jgi:D-alanyl-lipoteichoic acid acyltransferase DltB (MBOAT superfamily)